MNERIDALNQSQLNGYEQRQLVVPELKSWDVENPEYTPVDYTSDTVLTIGAEQGWADPVEPSEVDFSQRPSFLGEVQFNPETGRPLNPTGRQGITGRGELGKWGPNNAADPIVIAVDPEANRKILLIQRKDTKEWALAGGMVDPGEHVSLTAKRELMEEAGIDLETVPSTEIFSGYVDDPRNTDNAWMETVASMMVVDYTPEPQAGDDAVGAQWFDLVDIKSLQEATGGLYASHGEIIQMALDKLAAEQPQATPAT